MKQCVLALTVLCGVFAVSSGQSETLEIFSSPSNEVPMGNEPQMTLVTGLRALKSDMKLLLRQGNHVVQNMLFIRDLSDVVIQGNGSANKINITCRPGIGLAFFNISNLQIRDLTISGCGLNQERWDRINTTLENNLDMTFTIPRVLRVGILLAACSDVTMENLVVEGTRGIGLLGISLLGSTELSRVTFRNNTPPSCPSDINNFINHNYSEWIGGGAYFLYQDFQGPLLAAKHSLRVDDGRFMSNRDCSITVLLENFIERSSELVDLGYQVGAGGGLSVMMAQVRYTVAVSITKSNFEDNVARNGGGLHVGIFTGIPSLTTIQLSRCRFSRNGRDEIVSSGGGVIVNIDLVRPSEIQGRHSIDDVSGGVAIDIERSDFERNMANSGGGVAIVSRYAEQHVFDSSYRVSFQRCQFRENRGFGGSALLIYETKNSGFDPGIQLSVSDSRFVRNSIEVSNNIEVGHIQDYGVVHIRKVNLTLSGSTTFERNLATALGAVSSLVNVRGKVLFERNRAVSGAAMQLLSESLLIAQHGANITFISNRADMFGGAIYVDMNSDNFTFIPDNCFLYFNEPGYGICTNDAVCLPNSVSMEFRGNTARLGSVVYGSALTTCPWLSALRENMMYNPTETVYANLQNYKGTFMYDQRRNPGRPPFSTETSRLSIEKDLDIAVMPGEQFVVNISALDEFNNQVPEVITSNVVSKNSEEDNSASIIGDFGFFEVRPKRSTLAPITVLSDTEENVTIRLTTINIRTEILLRVRLTACVVGFTHSESQCVCDDRLSSRGISCDGDFTVDHKSWLGPIHDRSNISNDDLTVATCVLNYCEDGSKEIQSGEWDSQCREGFHRAGLLCGHCEEGYSLQLGTNACARCTNWSIFLLAFFLLAGLFLVFILGLLQISVAEGFFVAIIFYSNIITLYAVYFNDNEITGINFLTSFLSLNFGIPACFYDGMDSLVVVALQLVFVGYLFLLALVHIFVDKRIPFKLIDKMNQKYSPSKTFATLIIISYVSILQSSVGILSFAVVETFDGHRHIRWYIDPTVPYFQGFHAVLSIAAILLLFLFLLPVPILLTFCSRAIYRWRYFNKFKPLYDALYAPFKVKFRLWLGFQLFVRIVLFIFAYFVSTPHHLLALGVCLVIYLHLHTLFQPYISQWANLLESTLTVLALFYVVVTLYFGNLVSVSRPTLISTVAVLSTISYSIITARFIGYFSERNPKIWEKLVATFKKGGRKEEKIDGPGNIEMKVRNSPVLHPKIRVLDSIGNDVVESPQHRAIRSASVDFLNTITERERANIVREFEVSYTEYREPLLDQGELEIQASYSVVVAPNSNTGSPRRSPTDNFLDLPHNNISRATA